MTDQNVKKALRRFHYLRALQNINRISAAVRRVSAALSLLLLAVNLIGVIRTMGAE